MVVHELSTNAVKYGALSSDDGWIEVNWNVQPAGSNQLFSTSWTEYGGPSVVPPTHRGFGTTVVTKMIEMGLDGEARLTYGASGLVWQFACPLANVLEQT